MANKNDFTPEEWTKVLESIIAAGLAVSAVDPSGWWGTLKEAAASTPALAAAKRDPNSNELIKAAVADFERSNDGWPCIPIAGRGGGALSVPKNEAIKKAKSWVNA